MTTGTPTIIGAADRAEWRAWLEEHSATDPEVWLVIQHADRPTPGVRHAEAVEEALCFGWIDSLTRRHDAHSRVQRFSPRRPGSAWSRVNRERVAELSTQGLMTPRGQAVIDLAQRCGTWSMLAEAQDGVVPEDLRRELDVDPVAAAHFAAFSPSSRRTVLEWISRARRPETRLRRIVRTRECAARNLRP